MVLLPQAAVNRRQDQDGPVPLAIGMLGDLGDLPPVPNVPLVSVHYREEQDFQWGPGSAPNLHTGGPGGQNHLLVPLINKELISFLCFSLLLFLYQNCNANSHYYGSSPGIGPCLDSYLIRILYSNI